jgi:8-oxo-dGTP pyrophosphatase MutT (NUDIX family)
MQKKIKSYVTPKDAATIIIIKFKKKKSYVLMGRRPDSSKFMPGVHVFPGGKLEKEDFLVNKFFKLENHIAKQKLKTRSNKHTLALLLAAIRETSEETGLYLAEKKSFDQKPNFINNTWKEYFQKSYKPCTDKLLFFGRAITPAFLKIRFHARFFIAFSNDFKGTLKTNGELENLEWVLLENVKKNKIADVTEFMINEIIKLQNNFKELNKKVSFPMFTWKNHKRWIKWENIY